MSKSQLSFSNQAYIQASSIGYALINLWAKGVNSAILKTLNPAWGALSLKPAVGVRSFLEQQQLHFRLKDNKDDIELGNVSPIFIGISLSFMFRSMYIISQRSI